MRNVIFYYLLIAHECSIYKWSNQFYKLKYWNFGNHGNGIEKNTCYPFLSLIWLQTVTMLFVLSIMSFW